MRTSRVFSRLIRAIPNYRTLILQGGTSSTKTFSTLQFFYVTARQSQRPLTFSVVSESVPHLRRGVLRDWMNIIGEEYNPETHNKSQETFAIGNSMVEFFAVDEPGKARGGRRDYLFINECNRIPKETRDELEVRTRLREFLDFNPTSRFWAHDLQGHDGVWFDVSTYKDAIDARGKWLIEESIRKSIESRRLTNPNWFKVYGEGQIGSLEGLIIPDFEQIGAMPPGVETTCGLDFGFTNDPSVLIESGEHDDCLFINQLFHRRGMTNQDIVEEMKSLGVPTDYTIFGDCAEPKSIQEIYNGGFKGIRPCTKGSDCFRAGVDYVRSYRKICVTQSSTNVINDLNNAMWRKTITGETLNAPEKKYKHSLDAIIYSLNDKFEARRGAQGGSIDY